MTKKQQIQLFEEKKVRTVWDDQEEKWYFSIVDVVQVLTDSSDVKQYIKKMRSRDPELSTRWGTICTPTKMLASDGKYYKTQAATMEGVFRIIQSIPSSKAEPFKLWMAKVGAQRIDQMQDPELNFEQAYADYRRLGYSDKWINQRLRSIEVRKELTDEWDRAGVQQGQEYASLTDIITRSWSGKSTRQFKQFKGLHKENLRDNMTNIELALNTLAEASATEISKTRNPKGFKQSADVAREGGQIAGDARKQLEKRIGHSVISPSKASDFLPPIEDVQQIGDEK
ncbi:MAG: Bro-N domain-containing protein [Bacteroidales bacterium]|nr:Bro-N domain-containing protein [Bacteroidales bacterium]MBR5907019.1 Bro-N domain-containing protein [Bacteroidales bacterium]